MQTAGVWIERDVYVHRCADTQCLSKKVRDSALAVLPPHAREAGKGKADPFVHISPHDVRPVAYVPSRVSSAARLVLRPWSLRDLRREQAMKIRGTRHSSLLIITLRSRGHSELGCIRACCATCNGWSQSEVLSVALNEYPWLHEKVYSCVVCLLCWNSIWLRKIST